ncbi:MAG: gliding motility-associated C-terminal domain-containing protein [Chitinophagaceae bacterium]|jgi:gliding motility-associated-like protein|nr:gliding motility-associated C-terminal domain-containing protein [Chitinophagaceae bacterium]
MIKRIFFIGLITLQVVSLFAQVNLSKGLVAYYPFSGNTLDVSGNNLNATNFGASLTSDAKNMPNRAYEFNGTNANILLPYSPRFNFAATDSFSIACWIQPYTNLLNTSQALVVKATVNSNPQNANWSYGLYMLLDKAMSGYTANNFLNSTTSLQLNSCWYHIVVTYKNGFWYLYINGKVEAQELTQTKLITQDGSVTSVIALGKKGSSNGDYYKGKLDEVRIYNRNLSPIEVAALYQLENVAADFTFTQDACNPKQINLKTETQNINKTYWNFGNSQIDSNKVQLQHTYGSLNNYNIQLVTLNNFGCFDTIQKTIPVLAISDTAILLNRKDTSICNGGFVPLIYSNAVADFCWSSSNNSLSGSIVNPTVTPSSTTTYYLTTKSLGNNLIVNGDFELGNTGFESDYTFFPGTAGALQAIYNIANNPNVWLSAFAPCNDHTSGATNDKMMMIDGSPRVGLDFWRQTITVKPNTTYNFSFWLQSIVAQNPAVVKLKIDGKYYGNSVTADFASCSWKNYSTLWFSGNSSIVTVALEDSNLLVQGNDFAIDDLSFNEVLLKQDSVKIFVNAGTTETINKTICFGQSYNGHTTSGTYQDKYTNIGGCDSIINLNLIVLPVAVTIKDTITGCGTVVHNSITYNSTQLVTTIIKNQLGCDSIINEYRIVVLPIPNNFISTATVTICLGERFGLTGFTNYLWNTGETASNISLNGLTRYWLEVTNNNGCKGRDTIDVVYSGRFEASTINAFSPNGDGINDEFIPFVNSGCLKKYNIIIFNRGGQKIFENNDASQGWNGTIKNKPVPVGVYYFVINYETTTGISDRKSGSVTILR